MMDGSYVKEGFIQRVPLRQVSRAERMWIWMLGLGLEARIPYYLPS